MNERMNSEISGCARTLPDFFGLDAVSLTVKVMPGLGLRILSLDKEIII